MKILQFIFRGEIYQIDKKGRIKANGLKDFSDNWKFLGGCHHHFCHRITRPFSKAWVNPEILNGCLGFDLDGGIMRQWGGSYNGKLPRISKAQLLNE